MKRMLLTLVVLLIAAPLSLGLIAGTSYYTTSDSRIPSPAVTVLEQKLAPSGHNWQEPVFGGVLYREFARQPEGDVPNVGSITQPQMLLEVPDGYEATVQVSYDGQQVFSGSLAQMEAYSFLDNGMYDALLACRRPQEDSKGYGTLYYNFSFEVKIKPQLESTGEWVNCGEVLGITLVQLGSSMAPTGQSRLGPITFVPSGAGCVTGFLPIGLESEAGNYTATVKAGGYSWDIQLRVLETRFPYTEQGETIDAEPDADYAEVFPALYDEVDGERYWDGAFVLPVEGDIITAFGTNLYRERGGSDDDVFDRHTGINIEARQGAAIVAPNAGRVIFADALGAMGNTIVIEHGHGLKSIFHHLDEIMVEVDEMVEQGEKIGTAGSSGDVEEVHLHYEVRLGAVAIDPTTLFSGTSPITRIHG